MTMYINKNFRTRNIWIKKEIGEPEMCTLKIYFAVLLLWRYGMHGAVTIWYKYPKLHVFSTLYENIFFIIFVNLSCFLFVPFLFHSSINRKTIFLHCFTFACITVVRVFFSYHIPTMFLSLIVSWPCESASTFPFLTRLERSALMKISLQTPHAIP